MLAPEAWDESMKSPCIMSRGSLQNLSQQPEIFWASWERSVQSS